MTKKKYLIIHADDSGMSWAENHVTQSGMLKGIISYTSLMVPCPWFFEMAQFCLDNPDLDYGIHLTLTGEWKTYPFKPCLAANRIPSLVDSRGYFYPKKETVRDQALINEVYLELKRQIQIVLDMDLQTSHLDSHIYTLGVRQDLLELFQQLGKEFNLPVLLSKELIAYTGEDPECFKLPEQGCLESIFITSYKEYDGEGLSAYYDRIFKTLPSGVSMLLIHPAYASAELDQITIDHPNFGTLWRSEEAAYFTSAACKEKIIENNIELVSWKSPVVLNYLGA